MAKTEDNPMRWAFQKAPRCGAKTRKGTPCQAPAMANGRCRMHGGKSPGAPKGERNSNYKNGHWTNEAIAQRRFVRALIDAARDKLRQLVQ